MSRLPPHFDPLGETEPHTTVYSLTVYTLPRPPPRWLPKIFTREPVFYNNEPGTYKLPPGRDPQKPQYDGFFLDDLEDMPTKVIKIKSCWFPAEMRCEHVQDGSKSCTEGCYVLDKGGEEASRFHCVREDCEGHGFSGQVVADEAGKKCFGKKKERMVRLDYSRYRNNNV